MANDPEPAKLLLPYLQRADELQKHEPLVAYYCRLYAMDRGLKIPAAERTKTTNALLNSLMKQLEKDKKALTLGPEDNLYLEGFAMNVFAKADKQDRAGRADLNTAKTFYAASIFFEILNQFGPLQPDLEQKQKYAAWKAADVRKALKEGRKPLPGPPAGDDDLSILSNTPSGSYGFGPNEAAFGNAGSEADSPPQIHDKMDNQRQHSADIPPSSSYPSHDFHPPPSTISASSTYSSSYQHPTYPQEDPHPSQNYPPDLNNHLSRSYSAEQAPQMPHNYPSEPQHHVSHNYISESQQHLSNNYPSQEVPAYSYPHFQSYPSFAETSLPSVPSHYPYYQGPDASYPPQSDHTTKNYTSTAPAQYGAGNRNGTASEAPPMQKYEYDSNYQPPPEKIAEAHKSARFAVGALAFDDVSVAVDYLRKSLELLTNPSAGQ